MVFHMAGLSLSNNDRIVEYDWVLHGGIARFLKENILAYPDN